MWVYINISCYGHVIIITNHVRPFPLLQNSLTTLSWTDEGLKYATTGSLSYQTVTSLLPLYSYLVCFNSQAQFSISYYIPGKSDYECEIMSQPFIHQEKVIMSVWLLK